MAPIRVGLIGLSANAATWAANAHLPYLLNTKHYTITAVLNSSLASGHAAIKEHKLPESTTAHASPDDMAADPNVDLVVCSVHVSKHYETVKASLEAGKNVFVEWPLAATTEQAEEMVRTATEKKVQLGVVGLQGRFSSSVGTIKKLVDGGRIGKVLSSSFIGASYNFGPTDSKRMTEYLRQDHGGSMVTIHFAHTIDCVEVVLGPLKQALGKLSIQRPEAKIMDGESLVETVPRVTPDHVLLQGTFQSGALLTFQLRPGKPFPGTPGMTWSIYGDTGEIRITAPGHFLNLDYPETKIEIHDLATDKVEEVAIEKDEFSDLPRPAQNIARLYEGIAKGDHDKIADFGAAIGRHRFLESIRKSSAGNIVVDL